jgi:hypothetical protein
MAKLLECSALFAGEGVKITVNFDNVETLETAEQHGRMGTKITFSSGRYILVEQTATMLSDLVNATPS